MEDVDRLRPRCEAPHVNKNDDCLHAATPRMSYTVGPYCPPPARADSMGGIGKVQVIPAVNRDHGCGRSGWSGIGGEGSPWRIHPASNSNAQPWTLSHAENL